MIAALLAGVALAVEPVEEALAAELARATSGELHLPGTEPPYYVSYELVDGHVATALAEHGAVLSADDGPYRTVRVEVRQGSYAVDSGNFSSLGDGNGVRSLALPEADDVLALRRETWLATDEAYKAAVEQLARKLAARKGREAPAAPDFTPPPAPLVLAGPPARRSADLGWATRVATEISAAARGHAGVEVGQAVARDWVGSRLTLSSDGTRAWRETGFAVVRADVTTTLPDGTEARDARWWVAPSREALPSLDTLRGALDDAAAWLDGMADAPKEGEYLGPAIFMPSAATELFSQLLAQELVGSPPEEEDDESFFKSGGPPGARVGRRVLPLGWSVVDDPTVPGRAGSYAVDHEGVRPRRVELVRDGVVRDLLMSRIPTADRPGSTGHGRSLGDERRAAMPGNVTVRAPLVRARRAAERQALGLAAATARDYVLVVRRITPPALAEDFEITLRGEGPPPGLPAPLEVERLYRDGRRVPVRPMVFRGADRRMLKDIVAAFPGEGPTDMLDGPPGPARYSIGPTGGIPVTWDVPGVVIAEVELAPVPAGEARAIAIPPVPALPRAEGVEPAAEHLDRAR